MFAKQLNASQNQIGCKWGHLPQGPCETIFRNICEESSDALATVRLVCKNWQRISTQLITLVKCNGLQLRELCAFSHLRRIELDCYSQVRLPEYAGATLNALLPLKELAITGLRNHEVSYLTALAVRTDLTYFCIKMVCYAQECLELRELATLPSLTHFIPSQLRHSDYEQAYIFKGNQLRHLGTLTNLQSLALQFVEYIEAQDLNWLQLNSLTNITLSKCTFHLLQPAIFEFSSNLERLKIIKSRYDIYPLKINISNLKLLRESFFDDSVYIVEGFAQLATLRQLEQLTLEDIKITKSDFSNFQYLENLKEVNFIFSEFVPFDILSQMSALFRLTRINVDFMDYIEEPVVDELAFESWSFCGKVQKLALCGLQNFSPESTRNLTRFTNLHVLDLAGDGQPISRETLVCLRSLRQLIFDGTQIDDHIFNGVLEFTNLESLNLRLNNNLSDSSLEVISTLTNLTALKLQCGTNIYDRSEVGLDIRNNQFTERQLLQFTSLQKLRNLTLNILRFVTGRSLKMIVTLKELQKLDLAGCINLQRGSFGGMSALQKLKALDLTRTKIGNEELIEFSNLINLRELDLNFCLNVTKTFVQKNDFLKQLDLLGLMEVAKGYVDSDEEI